MAVAEKGVQDLYAKARKCIDEEHPKDPVREPFKSLYAASEHLQNALNNIKNRGDKSEAAQLASAQILFEIGRIEADTEEAGAGVKKLQEALEVVNQANKQTDSNAASPHKAILRISILNQLAVVDSTRSHLEDALVKLKESEELYNSIRKKFPEEAALDAEPHHLTYLLGKSEIPKLLKYSIWLEEEGTKSKYYMAQCYQHQGDKERAAMYCHLTLKKQLANRHFLSFFDPVDWAVNAATLSQFFLFRDNFALALHLLACADYMMAETKAGAKKDDAEKLAWRGADIARCWLKYAVVYLEASKDLKQRLDDGKAVEQSSAPPLPVRLLTHDDILATENEWRVELANNFEEAKQVFLVAQKKAADAISYYSLQDRASDYVLVSQDISKLYRDLAVFEPQVDRKCKMHKRRIYLLEEIVKSLNPKFYSPELQQIHFELGEAYTEMMELKYSVLPKGMLKPTDGPVNKINILTHKAMAHYQAFLDLIKDFVEKGTEAPDGIGKLEESYVRPALVARFSIGRLQSKTIVGHPREQLEHLEKTKKHYEYVEAYVKKFPDHLKFISAEVEVMRELMELLPQTIQNLISSTMY